MGPNNKDYSILGSILVSHYFGKLPYSFHFLFHYPYITPIQSVYNPYTSPVAIEAMKACATYGEEVSADSSIRSRVHANFQ